MKFTGYQRFVAGLLAFLQFAVILDFMIMSPLGALIMPTLQISPRQFGLIVSAYADQFDRKKLLLFSTPALCWAPCGAG